jgi:hypothetical protein
MAEPESIELPRLKDLPGAECYKSIAPIEKEDVCAWAKELKADVVYWWRGTKMAFIPIGMKS